MFGEAIQCKQATRTWRVVMIWLAQPVQPFSRKLAVAPFYEKPSLDVTRFNCTTFHTFDQGSIPFSEFRLFRGSAVSLAWTGYNFRFGGFEIHVMGLGGVCSVHAGTCYVYGPSGCWPQLEICWMTHVLGNFGNQPMMCCVLPSRIHPGSTILAPPK